MGQISDLCYRHGGAGAAVEGELSTQQQPMLPFVRQRIAAHRESKREKIEQLFSQNLGAPFTSLSLHMNFGSAVRTRISEINHDPNSTITIKNQTRWEGSAEHSVYWSVRK